MNLSQAISPDTAYVVEDYPYGFRLRCKLRAWVEYKPGKGFRYVTQTTNPKKPGEVWNAPKASTYARVSGSLRLDDAGHIGWSALTEYSDLDQYSAFYNANRANLSEHALASFQYHEAIHKAKEAAYIAEDVHNIYNATQEQRARINLAMLEAIKAQRAMGRSY